MLVAQDQFEELAVLAPGVCRGVEGGTAYFLLPGLWLPEGCSPVRVDALLCPTPQDGYEFRLYFSHQISGRKQNNWHVTNKRILERNWFAFSYRANQTNLRLAQMVTMMLNAL